MWPFSRKAAGGAAGPASVPTIDVTEAFARSKRGAKLIDVRSAREYAHSGHPRVRAACLRLIKHDSTGSGGTPSCW